MSSAKNVFTFAVDVSDIGVEEPAIFTTTFFFTTVYRQTPFYERVLAGSFMSTPFSLRRR